MEYEMDIEGSAKAVDLPAIEKFEVKHKIQIPTEYKQFLLRQNGGHPKRCCFTFGKGPYRDSLVGSFFSVNGPRHMNLAHIVKVYSDRLPSHLVPIANDPAGNLIVMSCSGRGRGAVYFWDHESQRKANDTHRVAGSLRAFLAMLTEEKEVEFDWVRVRVSYQDGTSEIFPSNVQLLSLDRDSLVDVLDVRSEERIQLFGNVKTIATVEKEPD